MLSDLRRSAHVKASSVGSLWSALIDGVSPAIAAAAPMIPYALTFFDIIPAWLAFPTSMLSILFILGAFLGKISRENVVIGYFHR